MALQHQKRYFTVAGGSVVRYSSSCDRGHSIVASEWDPVRSLSMLHAESTSCNEFEREGWLEFGH